MEYKHARMLTLVEVLLSRQFHRRRHHRRSKLRGWVSLLILPRSNLVQVHPRNFWSSLRYGANQALGHCACAILLVCPWDLSSTVGSDEYSPYDSDWVQLRDLEFKDVDQTLEICFTQQPLPGLRVATKQATFLIISRIEAKASGGTLLHRASSMQTRHEQVLWRLKSSPPL